jgi:chromosome segregation ATPase
MAMAELGRRNGWLDQATGLVASHATLPATAAAVAERGGPLLRRRKLALVVPRDEAAPPSQAIESELARELDSALAEIASLKRRVSVVATAGRTLHERAQTSAAESKAADERARGLETDLRKIRNKLQEELDAVTAENAHLSKRFAERGLALDDAQERIKSLEAALSAAEARACAKCAEGAADDLGAAREQRQGKSGLVAPDAARLSQNTAAADDALGDARARIEFLQTALNAAEAECTRLTGEIDGARDKLTAESNKLNGEIKGLSVRAVAAEKELAQARERLLARIVEIDAVRHQAAIARAASDEAYAKHRQLEDALCLQQCQVEDLEQSRSTLIAAAKTLLLTFEDRDRALTSAQHKIKSLVERNAQLEAGTGNTNRIGGTDRRTVQQRNAQAVVHHALTGAEPMSRQDWAELAPLLRAFMERKRRSPGRRNP